MTLLETLGLRRPAASGAAPARGAPAPRGGGGEDAMDVRADVAAVLQKVLDLVLGGFNDDAARKSVHDEYQKLKAAFDKAGKLAARKSQIAAYQAILAPAQALQLRAEQIRFAFELWDGKLRPLAEAARAALPKLPPAAQQGLGQELDALTADALRYARAADSTALQTIVQPRLTTLDGLVTTLPQRSAEIDAGIAAAAKVLLALDKAKASSLLVRLAALQNAKKDGWPAGGTLDALVKSVDGLLAEAKALQQEGQELGNTLKTDGELASARYILSTFKPHIDGASQTGLPNVIEQRQENVRRLAKTAQEQIDSRHSTLALKTLGDLGTAINDMGTMKDRYTAFRTKFDAARNGPIKLARDLKLEPAEFAASRDGQLRDREDEIEASTLDGVYDPAIRMIDGWITESKAWFKASAAYKNLHGSKPDVGLLEDLASLPGGDKVLDRLVADLPKTTTPKVLITALKARYGVDVEQFEKLEREDDPDNPGQKRLSWTIDEGTKLDPSRPDEKQEVDLEGLYKVLGQVPVKDVKYVEKIQRVTKDRLAAEYKSGTFTDTIALHCGRPGDSVETEFNQPGQVLPVGEKPQAGCEAPPGKQKTNYFNFTVMHEVGHAVDDARSIMSLSGARAKDAGWGRPGTGDIAEKIAKAVGYDKGYIEHMLDDAKSTPPSSPPKPPKGTTQKDWDAARVAAEDWVKDIRVGKSLWDNAAGSKLRSIGGIVYHEAYDKVWVSYRYAARSQGITGYQFRAPAEWFAELYAAFHAGKLNPKHPATQWLGKLKAESQSA